MDCPHAITPTVRMGLRIGYGAIAQALGIHHELWITGCHLQCRSDTAAIPCDCLDSPAEPHNGAGCNCRRHGMLCIVECVSYAWPSSLLFSARETERRAPRCGGWEARAPRRPVLAAGCAVWRGCFCVVQHLVCAIRRRSLGAQLSNFLPPLRFPWIFGLLGGLVGGVGGGPRLRMGRWIADMQERL